MSEIKEIFAYIDQSEIKLEFLTKSVIYGTGPASETIMIDEDGEVVRYLNLIDDPLIDGQEIEFGRGAVVSNGDLVLLQQGTSSGKIIKVNSLGKVLWAFDELGLPHPNEMANPVIDGEGNVIYFCEDPDSHKSVHIKKRSPTGELLWTFPEDPFNSPDTFHTPHSTDARGLTVDVDGNIIYCTSEISHGKLIKVDKNGNLIWADYYRGSNPGSVLESDREGNIFISRSSPDRGVEKLNPEGEVIWVYNYIRNVLNTIAASSIIDYDENFYIGTNEVSEIETPVALKIPKNPETITEYNILDEVLGHPGQNDAVGNEYYVKFPPIDDTGDVRVYYYSDEVRTEAPSSDYSIDYLTGEIAFIGRPLNLYDVDNWTNLEVEYTSIPGRVKVTQAEWEWTGYEDTGGYVARILSLAVADNNQIYVGSRLSETNQPSIQKIDTSSAPTDGSRFADAEWQFRITEDEIEFNNDQNILNIFGSMPHLKWMKENSVGGS